jgi:23S rRNA (guanine745-N1)-methyltransferase
MQFKCPVCNHTLSQYQQSLRCPENHSFDFSREGYINLLLNNQKKSRNPGDSKEMLLHRSAFLNTGNYDRLLFEIQEIITNYHLENSVNNMEILDLGCGEGYYSYKLKDFFDNKKLNSNFYGIDISKFAVAIAAKRNKQINFIVGNSYSTPFFAESFDIIFSIFSQFNEIETKRILKPGGLLVIIGPGKNHLFDFIKMIYDNPFHHSKKEIQIGDPDFSLTMQKEINYVLNLNGNDISNLFKMTPYYWQATIEKQKTILELSEIDLEINFNLEVYLLNK